MRELFPGYFRPTPKEFEDLWSNGLIVLDTNILLHLFRYGEETRQEVLDILKALRPRVWIPYRVAFEFARRWRSVDAENRRAYEKLKSGIRKQGASLSGLFNDVARHQVINAEAERAKIDEFVENLCKSLDDASTSHPTVMEVESILEKIFEIIGDNVGEPPSIEIQAERAKTAQARYLDTIPPGYMDAKHKSGDDQYGDFYIWEEIIDIAARKKTPVIFITDDRKEDWILREDGRDIGPRPELVQEFSTRTGQKFHCYPFRAFLEHAKPYTSVEVSPRAIAEIEEDERHAQREVEAREEARRIAALGLGLTGENWSSAALNADDAGELAAVMGKIELRERVTASSSATADQPHSASYFTDQEASRALAGSDSAAAWARQIAADQQALKGAFGQSEVGIWAKQIAAEQEALKAALSTNEVGAGAKQIPAEQPAQRDSPTTAAISESKQHAPNSPEGGQESEAPREPTPKG